ncbi:hypothetical protein [Sphingobacterium daejeonense]|uniref:hypothetical protein n=1 Tax=Sphingobacterium daejeonense TaxID=371142 RepID=UPI0010C3D7D8|nr:hypothetical protein [Sphingobacterium daejeonense]VTQ01682.1 Uncharacterised protein [Sphingobacterium daejeonense]
MLIIKKPLKIINYEKVNLIFTLFSVACSKNDPIQISEQKVESVNSKFKKSNVPIGSQNGTAKLIPSTTPGQWITQSSYAGHMIEFSDLKFRSDGLPYARMTRAFPTGLPNQPANMLIGHEGNLDYNVFTFSVYECKNSWEKINISENESIKSLEIKDYKGSVFIVSSDGFSTNSTISNEISELHNRRNNSHYRFKNLTIYCNPKPTLVHLKLIAKKENDEIVYYVTWIGDPTPPILTTGPVE